MKRWLLVVLLCVGCGSSNPVSTEPEPPQAVTFDSVPEVELEAYIQQINDFYPSITVFFTEYGGVTGGAVSGLVPVYWSHEYTLNMIARVHALLASLHDMRPENSYLLRLHTEELEAAFQSYLDGITYFDQNLDNLTATVLDGLNQRMGAGNVHLIRLQIFLSDLAGRNVVLGEPAQQPVEGNGTATGI